MKVNFLLFSFSLFFLSSAIAQSPIDTLKQRLLVIEDDSTRITYLNTLAYHYAFNKPDSAFIALDESLKLAERMESPSYLAKVYYVSSIVYHYSYNYPKSLEASFKALKIYEALNDTFNIAFSYNELGTSYMRTDQLDLALEYFKKSIALKRKVADKASIARSINNIAGIYDIQEKYDLSLEKYMESIKLKEEAGYMKGLGYSYSNVANIYQKTGRFEECLEAITKAEGFFQDSKGIDWNGMIYVYTTYADYYEKGEDNNARALEFATKAYQTAKDYGSKGRIRASANHLSQLYAKVNRFQLAYELKDIASAYSDSLNDDQSIREQEQLKASYEIDKKEIEIDKQKTIVRQKELQRNALTGGFFLIVIIGGLVINRQKLSIKNKDQEKELAELKLAKTKDELELREQELLTYVISIAQKNNLLHNVKEEAEKSEDLSEANKRLRKINREIENGYNLNQQWEEFREKFEKIHQRFFNKLAEIASDLTNTDRRICAYLKLGLSSKQISNLQNVSVESVEVRRSQIRKKLGLTKEDNLSSHIQNIM